MEYIEGETLAERLQKGALPLGAALRYGTQVADALDKAHRQGIVEEMRPPRFPADTGELPWITVM